MNFVLKPSLEQRALVKMAVSLWNQNDIGALLSLTRVENLWDSYSESDEWKEMEARVLERVPQLPLPQLLKEKVSGFIQIIGSQIFEWKRFHYTEYDVVLNLPSELYWTPQGTVDRKRTAEVLVRDESLDIATRYLVACLYCLEDSIHKLWDSMPEDLRESDWDRDPPIDFWSRTMKRRGLGNAPTSYKDGFQQCAYKGCKAAAEYFLQKLTQQEREESLVDTAKRARYSDVLCFLITEMNEAQQMEFFKEDPVRVLQFFLQWPWQSFFMEIANCMWDFLSKEDYECILRNIIDEVEEGYMDWNYPKLFKEFWQKSPHALKSFMTNNLDKSYLLRYLFDSKEKEIIRLMLQDATRTATEKLVDSDAVKYFCQCSILGDEWDYLEFCIRECFPSKHLMLKFKEEFEKREKWYGEDIFPRYKDKWDKLFLSSDDFLREYEKRSAGEGESSSSSKRFRSLQ